MSQYGTLAFYSIEPHGDPVLATERLLRFIGAEKAYIITRTTEEDRTYEALRAFLDADGERAEPDTPEEGISPAGKGPAEMAALYRPRTHLTLDLEPTSWFADKIAAAVQREVPTELRGDFVPCQLFVDVGYHDHIEDAENPDCELLARAFCSVQLFGYSMPNDWQGTRAAILGLPEVAEARKQLAEIMGPVETIIYWSA